MVRESVQTQSPVAVRSNTGPWVLPQSGPLPALAGILPLSIPPQPGLQLRFGHGDCQSAVGIQFDYATIDCQSRTDFRMTHNSQAAFQTSGIENHGRAPAGNLEFVARQHSDGLTGLACMEMLTIRGVTLPGVLAADAPNDHCSGRPKSTLRQDHAGILAIRPDFERKGAGPQVQIIETLGISLRTVKHEGRTAPRPSIGFDLRTTAKDGVEKGDAEFPAAMEDGLGGAPRPYELSVLHQVFSPREGRRLWERFEVHHTPKHASWLNVAECELSVLGRRCMDRRIESQSLLVHEVAAWQDRRNGEEVRVDWRFTTDNARIKLKRLYPVLAPVTRCQTKHQAKSEK
jgi:hypothetical protein